MLAVPSGRTKHARLALLNTFLTLIRSALQSAMIAENGKQTATAQVATMGTMLSMEFAPLLKILQCQTPNPTLTVQAGKNQYATVVLKDLISTAMGSALL